MTTDTINQENLSGMLQGVRVIDFTHHLAGPFCTRMMADLGAEVIKVEPPGGEATRRYPYVTEEGVSGYFLQQNCGKKSLCVDLRHPQGREIMRKLVIVSDVLVENYAPGVVQRLGLDYTTLSQLNPGLIMCSISGYGQDGPYASYPSADHPTQAITGYAWITGDPKGPPMHFGTSICDTFTGAESFGAICAALYARTHTGKGQYLDLCLLHSAIHANETSFQHYILSKGKVDPMRHGNRQPVAAPGGMYRTGDGKYLVLVCASDSGWRNVCAAMGKPELGTDPRFVVLKVRRENREALEKIVEEWVASFKSVEEALELMRRARIVCAPVNTIGEVVADPQVQARGVFAEVDDPVLGKIKVVDSPLRSSPVPSGVKGSAPLLGGALLEVLGDLLGYEKPEILELLGSGTVMVDERAAPGIFRSLEE